MSPILGVISPCSESGKTTLLSIVAKTVPSAELSSDWTAASIYRELQANPGRTLVLDEADAYMDTEAIRAILDSGHHREGASVRRAERRGSQFTTKSLSTWAPKAIGRLGEFAETVRNRSIVIRMIPMPRGRRVDTDLEECEQIRKDLCSWAGEHAGHVSTKPFVPKDLPHRAIDNWTPLLSLAEVAGDAIARRAGMAAIEVSGASERASRDVNRHVLLLAAAVCEGMKEKRVTALELAEEILRADAGQLELSQHRVGLALSAFGLHSKPQRVAGKVSRTYSVEEIRDKALMYCNRSNALKRSL